MYGSISHIVGKLVVLTSKQNIHMYLYIYIYICLYRKAIGRFVKNTRPDEQRRSQDWAPRIMTKEFLPILGVTPGPPKGLPTICQSRARERPAARSQSHSDIEPVLSSMGLASQAPRHPCDGLEGKAAKCKGKLMNPRQERMTSQSGQPCKSRGQCTCFALRDP